MKDNPCITFVALDPFTGEPIYKNKKRYKTEKEAIKAAKEHNLKCVDRLLRKFIAYKCCKCGYFHIGRSNRTITDKQIEKIKSKHYLDN